MSTGPKRVSVNLTVGLGDIVLIIIAIFIILAYFNGWNN